MPKGKSKLLFFVFILAGIFLLPGCAGQPTTSPIPTQTGTPFVAVTPTALSTSTPTMIPAETATLEPTPTTPPYTRCQEIIDAQLPNDLGAFRLS